jgi:hypothetical protein
MAYVPYPRGTILIPTDNTKHLFIIVTKLCSAGCHLLLNVSSIRDGKFHDPACVFAGGEHPFIKNPSYVYYQMADQKRAQSISDLVAKAYYTEKDALDPIHFTNVCDGIMQSKFTKPWVKEYFRKNTP